MPFLRANGEPLFSSHMLDLSEEFDEENIATCAKYFKRMAAVKLWLEMEIGITGGEEVGRGLTLKYKWIISLCCSGWSGQQWSKGGGALHNTPAGTYVCMGSNGMLDQIQIGSLGCWIKCILDQIHIGSL